DQVERIDRPQEQEQGERNGEQAQLQVPAEELDVAHDHAGKNDDACRQDLSQQFVASPQSIEVVGHAHGGNRDAAEEQAQEVDVVPGVFSGERKREHEGGGK